MTVNYSEASPFARIARIPDLLVNQIAAGEVVERPASALKEMVENSLDAQSLRIDILLRDGGITEISVVDNGMGIHPEDLALCLERHATSKIAKVEDLEAIGSFGFRGEALSAIAAVAEVDLKSRTANCSRAMGLSMHYGAFQGDARPMGAPEGTSVTVRKLFELLPARLKYLRSPATEFSHCARVVKELAIGNPPVCFYLHHQGRLVNSYCAPTRESRVLEAFHWGWKPLVVQDQGDGIGIEAYLSPGDIIQDRAELTLFINRRCVKNRSLTAAVRQAYSSTLGPHHEPSGVVYFDIRKDWVDVNVHPQKTQVRCLRQEALYAWLLAVVRKAIGRQPSIRTWASPGVSPEKRSVSAATQERLDSDINTDVKIKFNSNLDIDIDEVPTRAEAYLPPVPVPVPVPLPALPPFKFLTQLKASYLLCEDSQGLVVVDQHALHEKFRYEELRRKHLEGGGLKAQTLLIAQMLRLPSDLVPLIEENTSSLASLGFDIEAFGDGDWAVKSIPEFVDEDQIQSVIIEILESIRGERAGAKEIADKTVAPVLATIACHSVVRAGQTLSQFEAQALLDQLETIELGWTCPHGRPVLFRIGFNEIQKHFERK